MATGKPPKLPRWAKTRLPFGNGSRDLNNLKSIKKVFFSLDPNDCSYAATFIFVFNFLLLILFAILNALFDIEAWLYVFGFVYILLELSFSGYFFLSIFLYLRRFIQNRRQKIK